MFQVLAIDSMTMGELLYLFDPLFVSKNIIVISPLKCQIISEDSLSTLHFSVTEPSKSLPIWKPAGADNKKMDFSCLFMFTQHLTGSSLSIYFNIFQRVKARMIFPHANLWGIPYKSKHMQYMTI